MTVVNNNYDIQHAQDIVENDYGFEVSVDLKLKDLLKFGQSDAIGTSAATIATLPSGELEETFVYRNLIAYFSSTSTSDTQDIVIEGHTVGDDLSVTITQTSGTATATTSTNHKLLVGDWVYIEGANESGYNGIVQVATVSSPLVFTYTVDSGTASPATGTITATNQAKTFVSQQVTLAGQNKTALTTNLARCSRVYVPEQNRAANLVGRIFVYQDDTVTAGENDTATLTHMITREGKNNSQKAQTTLSDDDFWFVTQFAGHVLKKSTGFADIRLEKRHIGGVFREPGGRIAVSSGRNDREPFLPLEIVRNNSDVRLQAIADTSGTAVGGSIQGYLAVRLKDPYTETWITNSGATETRSVDALMRYLRDQGLSSSSVLYGLRSTHGTTSSIAYPCGGLTTNTLTWTGSPTVDSTGTALDGSTQSGSISDCLSAETLTVIAILEHTDATTAANEIVFSQYENTGSQRSVFLRRNGGATGDPYDLIRSSDGGTTNRELYEDSSPSATSDSVCVTAQWVSGGGRSLRINGTDKTLTLTAGITQTEKLNATVDILVGADQPSSPSNFFKGKIAGLCIIQSSDVTTAQIAAIEKLMYAI